MNNSAIISDTSSIPIIRFFMVMLLFVCNSGYDLWGQQAEINSNIGFRSFVVENDSPCPENDNGPFVLTQVKMHVGTTCGATGYSNNPEDDFPNSWCSAETEENAVWYIYEFLPQSEGIEITVEAITIKGNTTVEVFIGPANMGCSDELAGFQKAHCDTLPANIRIGPCHKDNDVVYIRIASTTNDCGQFIVNIDEVSPTCSLPGRDCNEAPIIFNLLTDPNYANIFTQCTTLCLDLACFGNHSPMGCDFSQSPTVWLMVEVDDIASRLITSVKPKGNWSPMWTIYYGNCNNLVPVQNSINSFCNYDNATTPIYQIGNNKIKQYYIAITADPNGPPIDNPNFEFCAYTRIEVLTCIGPDYGCQENDPDTEIEVLWREFDGPLEGPFCPGEELRIKIHFFYDASESQVDWFHGFIPDFGPGWDLVNFDWEAELPIATGLSGGPASFHEEGTECESELHRSFPHLCTYRDELGILRLVHTECDEDITKCDEYGMGDKDVLPNGFFWLSDGSNQSCVSGSCRPRQRWGIGNKTSTVDWEFNIKVREFDNESECLQNRNLQIGFLPFSDDGAGCWDDATPCRLDKKQFGPKWLVGCAEPKKLIFDTNFQEICTDNKIELIVSVQDGGNDKIEITYEDNPYVSGMKNHIFDSGYGIVDDTLTIDDPNICEPQEVIYYGQLVENVSSCGKSTDTFRVIVYPRPLMTPETDSLCHKDIPQTFSIKTTCSDMQGLQIQWHEPITGKSGMGNSITVDKDFQPGSYDFEVIVANEFGCHDMGIKKINVIGVDTTVIKEGNTLTAKQSDATYQWLNCYFGNAHVIGETKQSFTPVINGSYAVKITKNGCVDTSSCHVVILTSILENTFGEMFSVYPNPTKGKINVDLPEEYQEIEVVVTDNNGKTISRKQYKKSSLLELEIDGPSGIYYLNVTVPGKRAVVKVVKQ